MRAHHGKLNARDQLAQTQQALLVAVREDLRDGRVLPARQQAATAAHDLLEVAAALRLGRTTQRTQNHHDLLLTEPHLPQHALKHTGADNMRETHLVIEESQALARDVSVFEREVFTTALGTDQSRTRNHRSASDSGGGRPRVGGEVQAFGSAQRHLHALRRQRLVGLARAHRLQQSTQRLGLGQRHGDDVARRGGRAGRQWFVCLLRILGILRILAVCAVFGVLGLLALVRLVVTRFNVILMRTA